MANSYTQLGFVKQADGENIGSWGDVLNEQLIDLLDDAIGGYVEVSVASGNVTLAFADGTSDNNGRHAVIKFTGSPGTTRTITFPNKQKTYYINNGSDGSVICTAGSGAQTVTIATGLKDIIYVDGSDEIHSILQDGAVSEKIISSQTAITSGIDNSNDQLLLRDNSASALKKVSIASIFSSVGGLTDLSGDSSPQLGGNLDMNGNDIVTTSNADIELAANGIGKVVVKGNTNQGAIKFNCEANSHGITIKGPPHSAAASYTLTLPNNDGDADQVIKTDGSGVLSFTSVSALAGSGIQNVVEDTTPQLGGDLDVNGNQFVSTSNGNIQFTPNGTGKILFDNVAYSPTGTLTDGATINWDTSAIQVAQVTMAGNRTFAAPTNLIDGAFYALVIIQDGTGSRTATFNSVFKFAAATAPTLTTTANARDILVFQSNGTNLYESGRSLNLT